MKLVLSYIDSRIERIQMNIVIDSAPTSVVFNKKLKCISLLPFVIRNSQNVSILRKGIE